MEHKPIVYFNKQIIITFLYLVSIKISCKIFSEQKILIINTDFSKYYVVLDAHKFKK